MTPERWQHIDKLLEEALEIEASDRAAFLDQACAGDEALRRKIEDLLAAHARAQSFIETPAMEAAAQALARQARSMVGRQLDHYQILSFLGKGGMGEVYCARDTMLDRQVALKFLPAAVAADQDRLRRFIHEARAASAINHPNVATVYEIREIDGINFIAMEYVEGLTLQARLDSCTLEPADVVEFGFQIADALEAAHTRGIMHRDIKPANLMLTPRGQVKVLDFGLAKMTRVAELSEGGVGTLVTTAPGMVLGTVRYMSPEQVLGRELDHRTDIFSLGVVLFEMATGRLPFGGESVGEAMDQILHASPDSLTHFNDQAPAELERIVHKCLEKDRERRYQSARELMVDLRNLKRDSSAGTIVSGRAAPPSVSRTRRYALLALAVLIIVLGGIAWGLYKLSGQNQSQTTSSSAEPRVVPITNFPGYETQPSFSPDGNQLAFVRNGDIYVTLIGAGEPLRLTNDSARELDPVWSPDGRHLAFIRAGAVSSIYLIPALGGPERKLAEAFPQRPFNKSSLSYSPDGKFMAVADKAAAEPFSIFLLLLETGEKRRLTLPPGGSLGDGSPAFSPDGRMLAFARMPSDDISDIYVVPVNGGEPKRLTYENTNTFGLTWTPDSRSIVFSSRGKSGFLPHLWRIPATGGAPEQVAVFAQDLHSPTISRQGRRLAYTQVIFDVNIWRIGLLGSAGKEVAPTKLVYSTVIETSPDYSPDGKRIAFTSLRAGIPEIWVCDSNGENPIQLTSLSSSVTGAPRWSPDGGQIAFESLSGGNKDIYLISADGGQPRRLTTEPSEDMGPNWSRDGRWVYFGSNRSGNLQIWKIPSEGGSAVQVTKGGGFEGVESPDAKLFYYTRGPRIPGIWRIPVEGGDETLIIDHHKAGSWRYWMVVDQGIYFATAEPGTQPLLEFFSFTTGKVRQVAALDKGIQVGYRGLSISPDGRWIIYAASEQNGSDIMLMENFRATCCWCLSNTADTWWRKMKC